MIKWLRRLIWLCVLLTISFGATCYYYAQSDLPLQSSPLQVELRYGSGLKSVAHQLESAGVLSYPDLFVLLARLQGRSSRIKAGNYEFFGPMSPLELLNQLTRGDANQLTMTIVEGWTFKQIRQNLANEKKIVSTISGLSDIEVLQKLGLDLDSAEGWFYPNAYHVVSGATDLSVLQRAYKLMDKHLKAEWSQRSLELPLKSPKEALILASIVEKETGRAIDRPMVAAVFVNRLKLGMRLQTDPTVIYGMGDTFDGNIRKSDLLFDTPYNTYTRLGLPPTPIAMPGLEAIHATLHPAQSNALYFVGRGDGSSKFSETLDEHVKAVNQYQRRGRVP